ncbi:MAG: 4Fe-4S dicluster domain-containing protein [Candidatus Marinimicrobia bacterium]|nr:4Fe-4S dicluster domain-containing protein [Candidatus Neomarinimicrobiota bacterium]
MNKVIKIEKNTRQGLLKFLEHLFENDKISGVLTLRKINENGICDYGFITDVKGLEFAEPFAPVMPVNGAQILSSLTPTAKPIAAIIKPCELRGFVERVKREQGSLVNVLTISITCGGVLPLNTFQRDDNENIISDYYDAVSKGKIAESLRPTCKACENFVPMTADITIPLIGNEESGSGCSLILNSEFAVQISKEFQCEIIESELDSKTIDNVLAGRIAEKEKLYSQTKVIKDGLDELVDIFGKCVGCHGCSRVCPICYCVMCDFESHNYDYNLEIFETELTQKSALRLPPDTIFFQIGRLTHMSFSCVGCGQCEDVCPANIPVSTIFKKVGKATARLFDYIPGKDVEESIPVMIFKEEEFTELGD